MSIWTSLYTGASGLTAHGEAIGTVGDNIANVSTVGFKSGRASFQDVLGGTAPNAQRYGNGVRFAGINTQFGQGSLQQTGGKLDLAIRGNGFYTVAGDHEGVPGNYYTRDGQFHLDNTGTVVNNEGLKLQGYMIDATGTQSATLGDLVIGGQSPPHATTAVNMAVNLNSGETPPALPFDPANPGDTSNFSTSTTVYDSLGAPHRADVYYRNNGPGQWEWHALVDGGELTGGTPGTATEIATGTLGFTPNGDLDTETPGTSSADFLNATPGQAIVFDFGDAITTDGGTGKAGTTQYAASSSTVNGIDQDGFGAGSLTDVLVAEDGTMRGVFSNGQSRDMARIALATFQSEDGLQRAGNELFLETPRSGQALMGGASTGDRGAISAGSLEGSNVDLGNELVTMIAYQRAFSANSKTVTTADEMLQEVTNLKR
jgi:flagellar hook protein FlgE